MPQNPFEADFPSLWSIHVLVTAAREGETWDSVVSRLGMRSKHQVLRTVERFERRIGVRGLLASTGDDRDGPQVPERYRAFVDELAGMLDGWAIAREKVSVNQRAYIVRVNGYWSHIENFAAEAFGAFRPHGAAVDTPVRIELTTRFGHGREEGGAGLVDSLRRGQVDLVIAPDDRTRAASRGASEVSGAEAVSSVPLYRWALVAAVRPGHPLASNVAGGTVDREDLFRHELLVSPPGHRTRDLLDLMRDVENRFVVAGTSPESGALIALAHHSDRVAVVASDSALIEGPWIRSRSGRAGRDRLPPHWPALVSGGKVLGGGYRAYYREVRPRSTGPDDLGRPAMLSLILAQLAEALRMSSGYLDRRVARWAGQIEDCTDDYARTGRTDSRAGA
jgi:hypothetical protein